MNPAIRRRLEALEARTSTEAVRLIFADGRTKAIHGPPDFLLRLFSQLQQRTEISPGQTEQLELIRQSVDAREPGGSRLVEVLRVLLHGPMETQGGGMAAECPDPHG